jgi:hypothetical protein
MIRAADHSAVPETRRNKTAVEAVSLADIVSVETSVLVQSWKKWRGWNAMPPYSAWLDANLGPYTAYASVARVVDGGRDYLFEFIGGAHIHAYGVDHRGRTVSEIVEMAPQFGRQLKASYDLVRISGNPHAFQGSIGPEHPYTRFTWFETAYLPLRENGTVSHILNAAMYKLRREAA